VTHLLDTSVCVDVLRGRQEVIDRLQTLPPDDCVISSVSVFELLSGAKRTRRPGIESEKVYQLVESLMMQSFDELAAEQAAKIRFDLEKRGVKIGAYDTLLAGHALALNLICVTSNDGEFSRVDKLRVENWRR